jgi:DNA-binding FadR family transcriptional regulator
MLARSEKVSDRLAKEILRDIISNDYPDGAKLPAEAHMLEQYPVGRASLREALRILEVNGVLRVRPGPGGGPVVAMPGPRDFGTFASLHFAMHGCTMEELFDARIVIEPLMTRRAAEHTSAEARERLFASLDDHQACIGLDSGPWSAAATGFHQLLGELANNGILDLFSESLVSIQNERVRPIFPIGERKPVLDIHRKIAEAVIAGDGAKAERLMRGHLQANKERTFNLWPAIAKERIEWI